MTETITAAEALDALLEAGYANAEPSVAGGALHGAKLEWGDTTVFVTTEGAEYILGLYTADEWETTGEPHILEGHPSTAALVAAVHAHLGVDPNA